MFELNENVEVTVKTVGPQNRKIIIADNFYKNPDEVRELGLILEGKKDPSLISALPGLRKFQQSSEIRKNLKPFFDKYCLDDTIWNKSTDEDMYEYHWSQVGFMCNVLNYDGVVKNTWRSLPHQDSYEGTKFVSGNAVSLSSSEDEPVFPHFGVVIYMNTPDECAGGTNLYSYEGKMTLPYNVIQYIDLPVEFSSEVTSEDKIYPFIRNWLYAGKEWKVEYEAEMKYNRCIFYEADTLHTHNIPYGTFTNHDRINQVFFL